MGKFKQYGGISEWDGVMSEYVGMIITVHNLTEIRTKNGQAYVATCDISDGKKQVVSGFELLVGGQVPFDQLTNYLHGSEGQEDRYPFNVVVHEVERTGLPNYWILREPEETTE